MLVSRGWPWWFGGWVLGRRVGHAPKVEERARGAVATADWRPFVRSSPDEQGSGRIGIFHVTLSRRATALVVKWSIVDFHSDDRAVHSGHGRSQARYCFSRARCQNEQFWSHADRPQAWNNLSVGYRGQRRGPGNSSRLIWVAPWPPNPTPRLHSIIPHAMQC